MTLSALITLFVAMLILALIPGPGIFVVVSRTMTNGLFAGIITALGIVLADFIFIFLAVSGMTALSEILGELFLVLKYVGAVYLMWLGYKVLSSSGEVGNERRGYLNSRSSNLVAGLLTTLSNPKAILFYASFFPTFVDLSALRFLDIGLILLVTVFSVGSVMVLYAYLTHVGGGLLKASRASKYIKLVAGSTLMTSGALVVAKA